MTYVTRSCLIVYFLKTTFSYTKFDKESKKLVYKAKNETLTTYDVIS